MARELRCCVYQQALCLPLASPHQNRVGDVGELGIDALEIAQQVEVNRARLEALAQPLVQPLDVRLGEILRHLGDLHFVAQELPCQLDIPTGEGRDREF